MWLSVLASGGFLGGIYLAEVTPIDEHSALTLGLVGCLLVAAFGIGKLLTKIQCDMSELKHSMEELGRNVENLPCKTVEYKES